MAHCVDELTMVDLFTLVWIECEARCHSLGLVLNHHQLPGRSAQTVADLLNGG